MVTASCQPSSRREMASCMAAWPPPTMSTPPGPGDPADVLPDNALGIACPSLHNHVFILNGQSYLCSAGCQRSVPMLLTGARRERILRTNRSVQVTNNKDDRCPLRPAAASGPAEELVKGD